MNRSSSFLISLFVLFLLINNNAVSQSIEISSGAVINRYFDYGNKDFHVFSKYEYGQGYFLEFSLDEEYKDWISLKLSLAWEHFSGSLSTGYGGLGGSNSINAQIKQSILSGTLYPIGYKIKNIDIDVGLLFSFLILEEFSGTAYSRLGPDSNEFPIEGKWSHFSYKFNSGIKMKIAYDIPLTEKLFISPNYAYYLGFTKEFDHIAANTKSMRHYIGIGLERKFR